jgi:biofilm PGA synthesis N-glycosyltransferase PgaC
LRRGVLDLRPQVLRDLGGWEECVGEDIVLTWCFLQAGWRVGHAEDACCFTKAPESLRQFIRQRQRWARGMMEAFRRHPRILFARRLSTLFVWWNLLFHGSTWRTPFSFCPA